MQYNMSFSFNDVLYSCNLCLISSYSYDVGNYLFDSISFLLKYSLTSLQIRQNGMQYLKECLTSNTQKTQKCNFKELNPSFLYDLHNGQVSNEHQYIEKMSQSAIIGGLWEDFTSIFWIVEYLQWLVYVWNKDSNKIMCKCGLYYQIDPLHIDYSNQHFEPIEYACDIKNIQFQFETQDWKSFINLDDYQMLSKPMK